MYTLSKNVHIVKIFNLDLFQTMVDNSRQKHVSSLNFISPESLQTYLQQTNRCTERMSFL